MKKCLTLIFICIVVASLMSDSGLGGPIMLIFTLLSASLIITKIPLLNFSCCFCELVLLMIIYSTTIQILNALGLLEFSTVENKANEILDVYGGCIFHRSFYGLVERNGCFFREPGVFMVYICVAYLLDCWVNGKVNFKRQILYLIGILSTMSTAGIIIWGIAFVMNFFRDISLKISKLIPMIFILIALVIFFSDETLFGNIFAKFDEGSGSDSVLGRISSIFIPLKMTFDSPLWGCGTANFHDVYIECGKELYHTEIDPDGLATNTVLNASAIFGLWFGIFIICGLFKLSRKLVGKNFIMVLLFFVCALMIFSNETMVYSLIFYILVFYGFFSKGVIRKSIPQTI